ncbi:MAG: Carboxypeptidase regulatory-like domain, partial [Acidobacteriota bacterium]
MKPNLLRLVVVLSLLVFPWSLYAQTVTGSLSIRVLDRQNAVIPGATVTIRNDETGFERTQTTDADGLTTFVGLPPGR